VDELQEAIASIRALRLRGAESSLYIPHLRILADSHGKVRVPTYGAGARLYRATRHHTNLPARKEDLWFPPADRVKAGRENYEGQPVFYGSAHQSPALAEIAAGPYNICVISEWVTQDIMYVQDLGFEEQAFGRFGVDRQRLPHQVEDIRNASEAEKEARRFISDAFLSEGEANYPLTAAIADVFTHGVLTGIRYPSLALKGRSDNFALRPDYVREKMRLEAATYFYIKRASDEGMYDFDPIADLTGINRDGSLSWTHRDHRSVIPPQAGLKVNVPPGDRVVMQIHRPMVIVLENRRYAVVPGAFIERLTDGIVVKSPEGNIIEGLEVEKSTLHAIDTTGGKDPTTLAREANSPLKAYQTVIAITVRLREIAGRQVAVATAVVLSKLDLDSTPWTCQQARQSAFEFHDPRASPECIAWWKYVHSAQDSSLAVPALVIVEGGIETVAAINARVQPLLGKELLPVGFTLACNRVSAEPTDFVSSKALSVCVEEAVKLLDWLEMHPECSAQTFEDSEYYSRARVWTPK
jgi:hypothetical protein